jgi:hypothetical protein
MRHRERFRQLPVLVVAVLAGAVGFSCGAGPSDNIVGPTLVESSAVSTNEGAVTASGQPKQDLCHYQGSGEYKTLSLPPTAVEAHLSQHAQDSLGACVVPCPCFTAQELLIAEQTVDCAGGKLCDTGIDMYQLPGSGNDPSQACDFFFEASKLPGPQCTGAGGTQGITSEQFEACKALIAPKVCS